MINNGVPYLRVLARAEDGSGAGDWAEAARLWVQVVTNNPVNGNYWARLAEARFENKDYAAAAVAYEKARDLGVQRQESFDETPSEIAYRIACCHAGLGDREQAVDALERALAAGFRDLDRARADDCWEFVRAEQRVRDLLGIVEASDLSRDEGWRIDLWFMAREVKRLAYAPFGEISEADFDRRVAELVDQVPVLSDAQIIVGMMKLVRFCGDGHAFVRPAKADQDLQRALPVDFYDFAEGTFVIAAAPEYRRLIGAQLEKVGAHDLAEVQAALDSVISRDNDLRVRFVVPRWLVWTPMLHALGLIDDPDQAVLTVRLRDGSHEVVTVPAVPSELNPTKPYPVDWIALADELAELSDPAEPLPLYLRNRELPYWFDYLPGEDVVYFQFNAVVNHPAESFAAFCDRLFGFIEARRPGRLVIDLRWNGGGNTALVGALLHHLIGCPTVKRRGALFVVIGRQTFSAAQNTATYLERETAAVFVGEPTGSRPNFIGETIPFELPVSGVVVNVADLYWQTSWPSDHRTWIAPQIYAPPTFEAFSRNQDPAMDAILTGHEQLPGI